MSIDEIGSVSAVIPRGLTAETFFSISIPPRDEAEKAEKKRGKRCRARRVVGQPANDASKPKLLLAGQFEFPNGFELGGSPKKRWQRFQV
jgi:hypothetical protein